MEGENLEIRLMTDGFYICDKLINKQLDGPFDTVEQADDYFVENYVVANKEEY